MEKVTIADVVEYLCALTIKEMIELIKELEIKFELKNANS